LPSLRREMELRNTVVSKFSSNIFGRENIKLGLLLGLLGGVSIHNEHTRIRGQSHILLIG
jgi:DNA replicative helicase MCM subunit Mcm2 (Cdc46/Mcm family)